MIFIICSGRLPFFCDYIESSRPADALIGFHSAFNVYSYWYWAADGSASFRRAHTTTHTRWVGWWYAGASLAFTGIKMPRRSIIFFKIFISLSDISPRIDFFLWFCSRQYRYHIYKADSNARWYQQAIFLAFLTSNIDNSGEEDIYISRFSRFLALFQRRLHIYSDEIYLTDHIASSTTRLVCLSTMISFPCQDARCLKDDYALARLSARSIPHISVIFDLLSFSR